MWQLETKEIMKTQGKSQGRNQTMTGRGSGRGGLIN